MKVKKRITLTLVFILVFNFLHSINVFADNLNDIEVRVLEESSDSEEENEANSDTGIPTLLETGFLAIGVKDNTKVLTNEYVAKNGFQYIKGGVYYTTSAFDFHIFSREAILNAHTNGNIATKALFANGAGFGTNQSSELNLKEENYFMNSADGISNIASDGNIIIGTNIPTELVDNNNSVQIGTNGNKLGVGQSLRVYKETSESTHYMDIDNEFENLRVISNLFANHGTSLGVTLSVPNGENQAITVDGSIGNIYNYYLNVNASKISNGASKRVLNIVIPEGKTLIINVDMAGVSIHALQNLFTKINNYSNSEDVVRNDNNILWNLYDSSAGDRLFTTGDEYAKVGMSDYFMGTILAPNANIQYGAVNGSIIANKTKQNSQESHKWDFTGHTEENTSVILEARKNLVGKDLEEGMFQFELLDKEGVVLQTVSNQGDGTVQFAAITYDVVGDYEYTIREVQGSLDGIIYERLM